MDLRFSILTGLLFVSQISAQELKLDILAPSIGIRQDSVIVSLKMMTKISDLDPKSQVRLTPILKSGAHDISLPAVVLNGEKAQKIHVRTTVLNKRRGKPEPADIYQVLEANRENLSVDYRMAIAPQSWMKQAELLVKEEVVNGTGSKVRSQLHPVKDNDGSAEISETVQFPSSNSFQPATKGDSYTINGKKHFKGSYLSPESDATDVKNQKELNFSLDEAQVIAEINPGILSLRELYTVALSYKNNPEQFYKVIETSVRMYPASPIANLNAAAAAIEQGNIQAAGRYLQMASRETVAYKNCRGAYELLCNNTYEGIRLLKAAKAAGSEEADNNLKLFFELNEAKAQ